MILHDRDLKLAKEFTRTVKEGEMKTNPLPVGSPNLNGCCERFMETTKMECLSKFFVFGEKHFDHLISEFVICELCLGDMPIVEKGQGCESFQRPGSRSFGRVPGARILKDR